MNKLQAAREAKGLSLADAAKAVGINVSLLKAYETGYAEPLKYWYLLEDFFGKGSLDDFRITTEGDAYQMYNNLLQANPFGNLRGPRTLKDVRNHLCKSQVQMSVVFNVNLNTYVKWENTGHIAPKYLEVVERLTGKLDLERMGQEE